MPIAKLHNPALLVIDAQVGFEEIAHWGGNRNNPAAAQRWEQLLAAWRVAKLPIFHIRHSSLLLDSPLHASHVGFAYQATALPQAGEIEIVKHVNSAFIGTNLLAQLHDKAIDTVILVGLTTNHCISTTARMASNFGLKTYVVADATACFDRQGINGKIYPAELVHQISLANLNEEFATVLNTNTLLEYL